MSIKCGISTANHTPYTNGKWREGNVMDSVLKYEQKLEREKKIRLAIRKVRDERKRAQAQRYKQLRDKWGL